MSKCRHLKKQISRYIDNDLDDSKRRWLEAHMALCDECTRVYTEYAAMKDLVRNSYAGHVPETAGILREKPLPVRRLRPSPWNSGMRLAAMLVLGVSIFTGILIFSSAKHNVAAPVDIGSESSPVMNTPLGAIVYYEELAGTTVHTQYLQRIRENAVAPFEVMNVTIRRVSGYKSPLFCDSLSYMFE